MSVFSNYAKYYDLLYRDKDYSGEAKFVSSLIKKHAPGASSILELGCGTGGHAEHLARSGMSVYGVDLSEEMLRIAGVRLRGLSEDVAGKLHFEHGDIRSLDLAECYDVVLSLFHVISYQTSNDDLLSTFKVAKKHLKPGGVFIFDCWYGPGVLTDRPQLRVKRLSDDSISVLRIAEPVIHPNENIVDVNYTVQVKSKKGESLGEYCEQHRMRYLFAPEVDLLLKQAGMQRIGCVEWLSGKPVGFETWSATFIAIEEI